MKVHLMTRAYSAAKERKFLTQTGTSLFKPFLKCKQRRNTYLT